MYFLHHKVTLNSTLFLSTGSFKAGYVGQVHKPHKNATTSLGYFWNTYSERTQIWINSLGAEVSTGLSTWDETPAESWHLLSFQVVFFQFWPLQKREVQNPPAQKRKFIPFMIINPPAMKMLLPLIVQAVHDSILCHWRRGEHPQGGLCAALGMGRFGVSCYNTQGWLRTVPWALQKSSTQEPSNVTVTESVLEQLDLNQE